MRFCTTGKMTCDGADESDPYWRLYCGFNDHRDRGNIGNGEQLCADFRVTRLARRLGKHISSRQTGRERSALPNGGGPPIYLCPMPARNRP